jgi:uncharacterized protein (DUF433 family)
MIDPHKFEQLAASLHAAIERDHRASAALAAAESERREARAAVDEAQHEIHAYCNDCVGIETPSYLRPRQAAWEAKMSRITRRPDTMGGAYCLAGERMPVVQVKRMMRDCGREWIRREFPWMTDEQIAVAMAFRVREAKG